MKMLEKTHSKTVATIAILCLVKAIFEKSAAMEVDALISPVGVLCSLQKKISRPRSTTQKGALKVLEGATTFRKSPHAHKNKIGTPTPPSKKAQTPPLKGGILWAWGLSSRKNRKMPVWASSSDIFYFPSFSKGGGWGSQRGGGNSSKIRGKRGTKGGGREEG